MLSEKKVGDTVTRLLGGRLPMELKVTEVTDDQIICGAWKFNRQHGYEIDEDLGWGTTNERGEIHTGSYLVEKVESGRE